jgi:2-polyprenyl-6-hydroxyphenyl methylase/3-demethylubiquinone-9 3-methyltransferase
MSKSSTAPNDARFRFGENWRSFLATIDAENISEAQKSLRALLRRNTLSGARFLDIGCGSGLFSLAARNLGATVHSFDFDADSVQCTHSLKDTYRPSDPSWTIDQGSILDEESCRIGHFDIVYAWGVLHHTGDMRQAIKNAASLVAPAGHLAVALYRKTPMCRFWAIEKRWYSQASQRQQELAYSLYVAAYRARLFVTGKSFRSYVASYKNDVRAMDFHHNARDWLGGYPYESISKDDAMSLLADLGFECIHNNCGPPSFGLLGSGCNEFLFRRA